MTELIDRLEQALLALDRVTVRDILKQRGEHQPPMQFIEQVMIPTLTRIGDNWEHGTIALSQVYMSGRMCEELVDSILPAEAPERKRQPKMAIALLEDYHNLGKRIVYSVLRASGFELLDYGRVTVAELVNRTRDDRIDVLLISVLMLPSALRVKEVTTQCRSFNPALKIVVGGAPFNFDAILWQEVGADVMGHNASEAVEIVSHI
jgi:methanogenic corrinoid protein MtbC1